MNQTGSRTVTPPAPAPAAPLSATRPSAAPGTPQTTGFDVHQHLWPSSLIEALRARNRPPMLRDWTLHLTASRAKALVEALHEVVESWPEDDDDPDAAPFKVNVNAFLRPGTVVPPETGDLS